MICLYPEESCEITRIKGEVSLGGYGMGIVPREAFLAIMASTPIQFCFELLCILIVKTKIAIKDSLWQNSRIMLMQILMTLLFITVMATLINFLYTTIDEGRPELILPTFLFAFLMDQAK
jgi:hypothetical protein